MNDISSDDSPKKTTTNLMRLIPVAASTFVVVGSFAAWWLHTGSMADNGLAIATERIPIHFWLSVLVAGVAAVTASWVLTSPSKLLRLPGRQFSTRTVLLALSFFAVVFAMTGRGINRVQNARSLSKEEELLLGTWEREMNESTLGKGLLTFEPDRSARVVEWINSIASTGDYCWKLEGDVMYLGPIAAKTTIGFADAMTGRTPRNSWRTSDIRLLSEARLQVGGSVYHRQVTTNARSD